MKDTKLYQQLLGLTAPWTVSDVTLDVKAKRVAVRVEHNQKATFACPECGAKCGLHDHDAERTWRHLDSCHFETHLVARVPRIRCPARSTRSRTVKVKVRARSTGAPSYARTRVHCPNDVHRRYNHLEFQ